MEEQNLARREILQRDCERLETLSGNAQEIQLQRNKLEYEMYEGGKCSKLPGQVVRLVGMIE